MWGTDKGQSWGDLYVIGGESVYAEALPVADRIYLTLVDYEGPGDTVFPEDPSLRFEQLHGEVEEVPADDRNSHASRYLVMYRRMGESA
jgi:dihydrofolate reductase